MLRIKPFRALRPPADLAGEIASVPYDVVSRGEASELASGNEKSFLHVVRPDIDLAAGADDEAVFAKGAENLRAFVEHGWLKPDEEDSMFLYRQEADLLGGRVSQTGLVCCCHVEDYAAGRIKKHEHTRKKKEDERTRMVLEQNANAEPVLFMVREHAELSGRIASDAVDPPVYDFTAADGVRHTVWRVADPGVYRGLFAEIPAAYVADGHHRTASAARAGAERRAANPGHTGEEEYNWFLAVVFPADELTILPYHRVVSDLNGMTAGAFLDRVRGVASVETTDEPEPAGAGSFGLYVDGSWYRVTFDPASIDRSDPVGSLDYVLLSERVLGPILGIEDIRTDARVDFVGGIRGAGELSKRVDGGDAAAGFCMHGVTIESLLSVADAGEIMPPKSTWFEPKLRSGLFVHELG